MNRNPVRLLCLALLLMCLAMPWQTAWADDDGHVVSIQPAVRGNKLEVNADIDLPLSSDVRDAAERGLPLYFTMDLDITRPRWWWFDSSVLSASMTWHLVYNALTRQWRVGTGALSVPVASLDEGMQSILHVRHWFVADVNKFDAGVNYEGQLRLRLDTSLMTRPFQVNALNSSSWSVQTPWRDFNFSIGSNS